MKNFRNNSITGIYESEQGLAKVSLHFTEWWNGEGMDFTFDDKTPITLHCDEIRGLIVSALATGMVDVESILEEVFEMKQESQRRKEAIELIRKKYE